MSDMKLPEGDRVYAVGDIHGRLDLLDPLLSSIASDIAAHPGEQAELIFLGDFIDRGPESKAVIDRLAAGDLPAPATFLMGNHEEMLLSFLERPEDASQWLLNGGEETLRSYGMVPEDLARHPEAARDRLLQVMPGTHLQFFESLQLSTARSGYFFCHAGVRPGVPLDQQDASISSGFASPSSLMREISARSSCTGTRLCGGSKALRTASASTPAPSSGAGSRPSRYRALSGGLSTRRFSALAYRTRWNRRIQATFSFGPA